MNPRLIHDLMREHFPGFDAAKVEWTNIVGGDGPNVRILESILEQYISTPEVVVEVHRDLGEVLPKHEAAAYIISHMGQGQIRVADRSFTAFVVVAQNGDVAGWGASDSRKSIAIGMVLFFIVVAIACVIYK